MKRLFFILLLFCAIPPSLTFAQELQITGVVSDASDGSPIIGATVLSSSKKGTATDINGRYTISAKKGETLTFSYLGMESKSVKVESRTAIDIALTENNSVLNEVVVVGYGTMKKRDLSGSIGQIKAEDLMKGNPSDFAQGLQGKMAGVSINQNDGAPGAGLSITVRGANSITTGTQPLYIVDGVPFDVASMPSSDANANNNQTNNPLSFINPHDIQSIEVLKDASATAIYGSRGANGVVLITTKRGEVGKDKVQFSSNFSVSSVGKKMKMLDAETYANYINEETINSYNYSGKTYTSLPYPGVWNYTYDTNTGAILTNSGTYMPAPSDYSNPGTYTDQYGNSTVVDKADWQDLIYQSGFSQEYNLSVTGGSDKGWHAYSGNYLDQEGIIKNTGFTRYSLRANIGRHVTNWLEIGLNTSYTHTLTNFTKTNAYDYGIMRSALLFPPTYGPSMDTNTEANLSWLAANPYAYVSSAVDELKSISVFNSSYAEIKLFPFLKFRQNIGLSYNSNNRGTYYGRRTQEGSSTSNINGKAGQSYSDWEHLTAESLLSFEKTFGIHSLNAVFGFTAENGKGSWNSITVTGFPDDFTTYKDLSRGKTVLTPKSGTSNQALVSLLGRVNYVLKDKYIFTASIRRDGSSRFSDNHKWADFLSGAFGWRASEETFIKNLNIFSNLKLRTSYGETGNQAIPIYRTIQLLEPSNYVFGGTLTSGSAEIPSRGPVSPDVRWESTRQVNAGVDFGFFDNRLSLTADYYRKKTNNLLQEALIPPSTGFPTIMTNRGSVINEGWEFSGSFVILQNKSFTWNVSGNISFNTNKIQGLDSDKFAPSLWYSAGSVFIQRNGYPMTSIYGYVEDGLYKNEAEVRADKRYANSSDATVKAKVGEIKYRDLNDDGEITAADKTIIGNTNPDFVYGITNNFSYKNFTMSFLLQGSQGNDIFNGNLLDMQLANIGNIPEFIYNSRFTEANSENAKWPKAIASYDRTMLVSNRYVEDGSYIRLKSLNLGYTWKPKNLIKGIDAVNLSMTATNLFTITNYSWFDPDVNAFGTDATRKGVDIYSYPSSRTFSFGLRVDF
jgi:TonB-linked SusC/RagA family outer membrane protein